MARRLILASSAPQGAAGMHGWAADVIGAVGAPEVSPDGVLDVFYTRSSSSRHAGKQALRRMFARTQDRDKATTWETRQAQYDAVCAWGIEFAADCEAFLSGQASLRAASVILIASWLPEAEASIIGLYPA